MRIPGQLVATHCAGFAALIGLTGGTADSRQEITGAYDGARTSVAESFAEHDGWQIELVEHITAPVIDGSEAISIHAYHSGIPDVILLFLGLSVFTVVHLSYFMADNG